MNNYAIKLTTFVMATDWCLFKEQKELLRNLIVQKQALIDDKRLMKLIRSEDSRKELIEDETKDIECIEGVLSFMNNFQDMLVDRCGYGETLIFNKQ